MKLKFLGATLLAVFAFCGTSCKSGKSCGGGGWYGNRNLGYESTTNDKETIIAKDTECMLSTETCATANP